MNSQTERLMVDGPAGAIECALDRPAGEPVGVMVVCHPHPQHGGTMDNKVVQTLARAGLALGMRTVRFNYRGVGASAGAYGEGVGEVEDALAVIAAQRDPSQTFALAGFSFGGMVAATAASRLETAPQRLALVAPSTVNFSVPPVAPDTLLIHGEADDVVPLSASLDWARPQNLPVVVLPGVGHFFHGQLALLKQIVVQAWR
jgi:alpha/beta superfamily hydrolase